MPGMGWSHSLSVTMGNPGCAFSLSRAPTFLAAAAMLPSLSADLPAPPATWQNVAPAVHGLSSSHLHRDSSYSWVPVPKSQGRFLIGLACRCLPPDQSGEELFASMVDSAVSM